MALAPSSSRRRSSGVGLDKPLVYFDQASCVTKIEQAMCVALGDYERGLVESDKAPDTVHTYVDGAERFIKYLVGTYVPWTGTAASGQSVPWTLR